MNTAAIQEAVGQVIGSDYTIREMIPVGGGCINEAFRISDDRNSKCIE